jgi:hypothetical protein
MGAGKRISPHFEGWEGGAKDIGTAEGKRLTQEDLERHWQIGMYTILFRRVKCEVKVIVVTLSFPLKIHHTEIPLSLQNPR